MDRYISIEWPDSQYFMGMEGVCFDPDKNMWFVPEKIYKQTALEVQNSEYEYGHNIIHKIEE